MLVIPVNNAITVFSQSKYMAVHRQQDAFGDENIHSIVEAIIFASPEPVTAGEISRIITESEEQIEINEIDIHEIVQEINDVYMETNRVFSIEHLGGGYTHVTGPRYHRWLQKFQHENVFRKVTPSALEALAIIAYKQPVTKPEIDHIRGVDSGYIVRQLLEKELVQVAGRADRPGRPLLYKTTAGFLKYFGINSTDELPKPREIDEILQDDEMAEHRQIMLELKAELSNNNHIEEKDDSEEDVRKAE